MSKYSVTIRGLRVVTTWWSWAWSNRISPSKWVGLGSPLAACSVYGDLTCSVHTVNNLCMFNCQCHFYLCNRGPYVRLAFVPNILSSWNKDIIIIIITSIRYVTILIVMKHAAIYSKPNVCISMYVLCTASISLNPLLSSTTLYWVSVSMDGFWMLCNDCLCFVRTWSLNVFSWPHLFKIIMIAWM